MIKVHALGPGTVEDEDQVSATIGNGAEPVCANLGRTSHDAFAGKPKDSRFDNHPTSSLFSSCRRKSGQCRVSARREPLCTRMIRVYHLREYFLLTTPNHNPSSICTISKLDTVNLTQPRLLAELAPSAFSTCRNTQSSLSPSQQKSTVVDEAVFSSCGVNLLSSSMLGVY